MIMNFGGKVVNPAMTARGPVLFNSGTLSSLIDNAVKVMNDNNIAIVLMAILISWMMTTLPSHLWQIFI